MGLINNRLFMLIKFVYFNFLPPLYGMVKEASTPPILPYVVSIRVVLM